MNPSVAELTSEHAENIAADEEEDFQDLEFTFQNQYGLNHDQAVAMKGMVNTECGVSLVHGPFGSGKTKLVASFIREHVASVKDMQHKLGCSSSGYETTKRQNFGLCKHQRRCRSRVKNAPREWFHRFLSRRFVDQN
jgi:predicted ATPase